ncbi:MAG: tetratricopeptide repeat protein [Gammaproteobacteria bacterium]|nr:tetratricopeptide repeat protein [Gammaproteobacteria bacterium]
MLRRRVYPVVFAYALVAWALLQIGEVTFEPLGLPAWVMSALVVIVIAGFPITAILAWTFDITPSGVRRDVRPMMADTILEPPNSIAVLPFTDMTQQQDQAYFCDGIAEAILNALTQIKGLHVAARVSSFRYDKTTNNLQDIGRMLGVDTVLEGSVRKSNGQLRITAQLVGVNDGFHLWSRTYDRKLEDIFEIQDEIASGIAGSLLNTMAPIDTVSTRDVVAYDYYLRGRDFLARFRKTDFEFARQMFHQAIEKDPDFALAWASYADCFSLEVMYADPKTEFRKKAREASKRALELQPQLAETHASAGLACLVNDDFECAEEEFNRAIELNPGLFEAYYYFGRARFHQGRMDEALDLFAKAASVNPDDYQSRLLRVQILRGAGQTDQAVREAREAIAVVERHLEYHPGDVRALHLGAGSLIVLGETERAMRWLQRGLEIDPDDPISLYNVACNYATLNKVEESLDYLERATEIGTVSEDWMTHDADLANLHSHPRYAALLETMSA